MPVDKNKLFQSLFGTFKKSRCGIPAGKVQSLCVDEWKKLCEKCRGDDSALENEVKAVMAREQATIRQGNITNFFFKGPSTSSATSTPPPTPTSSNNSLRTSDGAGASLDRTASTEGPESEESEVDDVETEGLTRGWQKPRRKPAQQELADQISLLESQLNCKFLARRSGLAPEHNEKQIWENRICPNFQNS